MRLNCRRELTWSGRLGTMRPTFAWRSQPIKCWKQKTCNSRVGSPARIDSASESAMRGVIVKHVQEDSRRPTEHDRPKSIERRAVVLHVPAKQTRLSASGRTQTSNLVCHDILHFSPASSRHSVRSNSSRALAWYYRAWSLGRLPLVAARCARCC